MRLATAGAAVPCTSTATRNSPSRDAALRRHDRAGARREPHARRSRLAALRRRDRGTRRARPAGTPLRSARAADRADRDREPRSASTSRATRCTCGGTARQSSIADSRSDVVAAARGARSAARRASAHGLRHSRAPPPATSIRASRGWSGRRRILLADVGQPFRRSTAPSRSSSVSAASSASVVGRSNHSNVTRIAAPGDHVEHGRREIDAVDLRLAVRPQAIARVPEAAHEAGRLASGASGALIGGVRGDALELEAVDRRGPRRSAPPCAGRHRRRPSRRAR